MAPQRTHGSTHAETEDGITTTTERTPLLAASSSPPVVAAAAATTGDVEDAKVTSTTSVSPISSDPASPQPSSSSNTLPKTQILLLCYARLIEPIAFFSIFPYINEMVLRNGHGSIAEADMGFYSGLIESLFSLTQMLVMVPWGRAADRLGRKPVLVFSLLGVAVATSLFGLARSIWEMVLFRCLAGVFAGSIVTVRAMISENAGREHQAVAFSWFAVAGNLGIFIGPLLGGALADPARLYPRVFKGVWFFDEFPYALSSLVIGVVGLTAVITSALHRAIQLWPRNAARIRVHGRRARLLGDARRPRRARVSPLQISLFMGLTGLSQAIWLLLVFPPLQRRMGTNGVMRLCGGAYPFFLGLMPLLNLVLRPHTSAGNTTFWILAPTLLSLGPGVSMAFTGVQLALNDVSPSHETLGMLNALALTLTSGLRSFSPALFASLFAIGARNQFFYGYLVWVILLILALGFTVSTRFLPETSEKKKAGNGDRSEVEEDDDDSDVASRG
ncbi:hypothetical protein CIB48_g10138 [Xylaria polymorpha]|nr:hypothetical protein CIB48_g10138 [Xylaria polymorpha]